MCIFIQINPYTFNVSQYFVLGNQSKALVQWQPIYNFSYFATYLINRNSVLETVWYYFFQINWLWLSSSMMVTWKRAELEAKLRSDSRRRSNSHRGESNAKSDLSPEQAAESKKSKWFIGHWDVQCWKKKQLCRAVVTRYFLFIWSVWYSPR